MGIIAFSGLGGSGKSSVLEAYLKAHKKDKDVESLHLKKQLPTLMKATKKFSKSKKVEIVKKPTFKQKAKTTAYVIYLITKSWQIWLKSRTKTITLDRYFDDLVTSLLYRNRITKFQYKLILSLIPHADYHFYTKTEAEVVYKRKKEMPLNLIQAEKEAYDELEKHRNLLILAGTDPIKDKIKQMNLLLKKPKHISPIAWLVANVCLGKINSVPTYYLDECFRYADLNRCLYLFYSNLDIKIPSFEKYYKEKKKKQKKSLDYIKKHFKKYKIIKDNGLDSFDIDILTNEIKKDKDIKVPGGLKVDAHNKIIYNGLDFTNSDNLRRDHAIFSSGALCLRDALILEKNKVLTKEYPHYFRLLPLEFARELEMFKQMKFPIMKQFTNYANIHKSYVNREYGILIKPLIKRKYKPNLKIPINIKFLIKLRQLITGRY